MDKIDKVSEIFADMVNMATKLEDRALKESSSKDLSVTEMRALDAIGIKREKSMSQVAQYLNISMGTLTTSVGKLVKKGYVERFRIPEDRRVVKIRLTEAGAKAVSAHNAFRSRMLREAVSEMSPEEVDTFIQGMENISQFITMSMYRPLRDRKDYRLSPVYLGDRLLPVPLVQGGMGIGVSLGGLAGAAAACGGLGLVSAVEPGYREADYRTDPFSANRRALEKEVKKALAIRDAAAAESGKAGLVGVNVTVSRDHYMDLVRTAVEAGAEVVVSGGGLPMTLPTACEGSGAAMIPVVSSARAARLIKRNWKKKHDAEPAALIFESSQAGGYLGYKESQLRSARDDFFRNILEIREEAENIPMIAGGGIMTREDAARAYAYGADGIQLGTSFIQTKECDASEEFKSAYLNLDENDVTIIRNPQGMPCRVIENHFVKELKADPKRHLDWEEERDAVIRGLEGDTENGLFFCGSQAYRMKRAETVREVFDEFV